MLEFSRLTADGPTFCLAGIILDECKVFMEYFNDVAVALDPGEAPPSKHWLRHERSILKGGRRLNPDVLKMVAKARELWAEEYDSLSAQWLPFYALDWKDDVGDLSRVRAPHVIDRLLQILEITKPLRVF